MPALPDWKIAVPIITLVLIGMLLVNGIIYASSRNRK